ncbi:MAG: pyroglutamyl-peptidase I [Rubripirellula sp.]
MPRVLVTGFGPYANTPVNPAQAVAESLDGVRIGDAEVVGRIVPCIYFEAIRAAVKAIIEVEPEFVVMLGEFGGRAMLTVERIAQNLDDASRYGLADNAGRSPIQEQIVAEGPAAHYATLPIRAMVKAIREAGIPADISDAPGTLVCNHLMYGVLHHLSEHQLPIRAGWIHLPALPEVAARESNLGMPSMTVATSRAGVEVAIRAALEHSEDIAEPIRSTWQI